MAKQRQRASIEQLLSTGFVELLTPATQGTYLVNSDENFNNTVSKAEYEEYRRELEDYLRRNCTVVDKYEYDIPDVERGAVELYNCPVGKVGVLRHGDFANVEYEYDVEVGDRAWFFVKDDAYEILEDWRDIAEKEPYYNVDPDEIEQDIRKLMSMPE
jgi:hypothetical protein